MKIGEYEINNIYNEDCYSALKKIPEDCVDLVVTSPPYDNLRTYDNTLNWNFDVFKNIATELQRILKKGGVIVWIVNDATIKGSETGSSFKQALFFKEIGLNIHDTMIWKKNNPFNFGSNNCYIQSFEYMFIFSKGKPKSINFIRDRIVNSYNFFDNKKNKSSRRQRKNDYMEYTGREWEMEQFGKRYNVWEKNASKGYENHTAVFPLELVIDHIKTWSNEGDIVMDPFLGSGTTCLASKKMNRKFIGFEINKNYFEIAKKRIEDGVEKNIVQEQFSQLSLEDFM